MANYSEIRNILTAAKTAITDIVDRLGNAIGNYVSSTSTINEDDIYNMVKDLPQDVQVKVLCKALAKTNVKSNKPSYLSKGFGKRDLI